MNQILFRENLGSASSFKKSTYKKRLFQAFFLLSVFLLLVALFRVFFSYLESEKNEQLANLIVTRIELDTLYSSKNSSYSPSVEETPISSVLGTISIPKLSIYYPIFCETTDDFLKIGPCRFSGHMPPTKGNLCIAGHNYNNQKFFSRIGELKDQDKIILKNRLGQEFYYEVYQLLEVTENDSSPILPSFPNVCELTLITCNNKNNHRIIVKAKETNK